MSRKANPALVGSFVVTAVILLVVAVAYLGSGRLLKKRFTYVAYFEGSLQGLTVGSPVTFRGSRVGRVSTVFVRYDDTEQKIRLPVYLEFDQGVIQRVGGKASDPHELIPMLIERGLKAQLVVESLLTGQLAVELDLHPEKPVFLVGKDATHPELPTIPSASELITRALQNVPVQEIVKEFRGALRSIDQLVSSPELHNAIDTLDATLEDFGILARRVDDQVEPLASCVEETATAAQLTLQQAGESIASVERVLNDTLQEIRKLVRNVDDRVEPTVSSFETAAKAAVDSLEQARSTFATIQGVIAEDSELHHRLVSALEELSAAASSIRVLAEYLEQHPEALLLGKGPPGGR